MKVLLVFIDMMRTDLLSVYNQNVKDKTSFDLLLEKIGGCIYTNCYTPAPDTPRSLACLQTGLHPYFNGCNTRIKWPKYYVKEEVRKAGYLPNEEVWNVDATYENQNLAKIELNKEVENQPTETRITKTDATTGNELEGAKLQVIDKDGTVVEEWISTKEEHVIYGLPEGSYTLHEELAPYEDGYVSASDVTFEVKEDGSVTKVEMKDEYSKVEISKTDLTTGKELEGAKLQIIRKDGTVLEEWITDGKPHSVAKLPVNEELTLREITALDGYEIAEDVTFTLKDTMEVQKVEMKDARTPEKTTEKTNAPKTGDNQKVWAFILLGLASAGTAAGVTVYRRKKSKMPENKEETEEK